MMHTTDKKPEPEYQLRMKWGKNTGQPQRCQPSVFTLFTGKKKTKKKTDMGSPSADCITTVFSKLILCS